MKAQLDYAAWVITEALPLDLTGYLLYKATLLRHGVKAALPNTKNKHREAAKMRR